MKLKNLIPIVCVLIISSCLENNPTENENKQKDSATQNEQRNDSVSEIRPKKKEGNYTLNNFYTENYSVNDTIKEADIVQIGYTKDGLFLIVTDFFGSGKLLLLVDENKDIIDFVPFSNQTGDEYAEDIFVEIFPNDQVTYIKEARDYVVENPKVIETKFLFSVDSEGFTSNSYRKVKDDINDKIQAIRYYFSTVNDCINSGVCKKRQVKDKTDNKEYTCYICKLFFGRLDLKWEDTNFQYVSNYYLIGGKLFFIFRQQFNKNQNTNTLLNESRYYFFKDELIRIVDGKGKITLSESEMEKQQEAIVKEKKSIEKQFVNLRKQTEL